MLNNLRNFSKTKLSGLLIAIIIVPFVFWGMGGVFSSGNKNNIVKIDKKNVSIKDFMTHLNNLGISENFIKKNIENNSIENLISDLISKEIILLEIKKNSLHFNDEVLLTLIKSNKNFHDDKGNFSRVLYEKYLLLNNISAPEYENRLKLNELQKNLFSYISGGVKSPEFFIKQEYNYRNREINIDYISLESLFKKNFTDEEISNYINQNKQNLLNEFIDISFVKIKPEDLTNTNEFNDEFFKLIDEIDNMVNNEDSIELISSKYNLKLDTVKDFNKENKNSEEFLKEIYENRNVNRSNLVDKNDYFILYNIEKIEKKLPDIKSDDFKKKIINILSLEAKLNFNKNLITKINDRQFKESNFLKIADKVGGYKNLKLNDIEDNDKFSGKSVQVIFNTALNNFNLIVDNNNNIYLFKVKNIKINEINKNSKEFVDYEISTKKKIGNSLYQSYDIIINKNYKVNINNQSIEKVKNYFR